MAALEKYHAGEAEGVLRHNDRLNSHPSNPDIDPAKSEQNENFVTRSETPVEYLHRRLDQLYHSNRKDLVTMCEWVVTLPRDCPQNQEQNFFRETFDFLRDRYGGHVGENVVSAAIHRDESGQPHLHFDFTPGAPPKGRSGGLDRLCANDVTTRQDLRSFHGDLQRHLDAAGIHATVVDRSVVTTGKTLRQQYSERGEQRPRSWRPQERKLDEVRSSHTRELDRGRSSRLGLPTPEELRSRRDPSRGRDSSIDRRGL